MNLQDIETMWATDSSIDRTQLAHKSIEIPYLHSKYYKLFVKERMALMAMSQQLKNLRLDKAEFYMQGPTRDTPEHWKLPDAGRIRVKSDLPIYLEADRDIQELEFKIALQTEKTKFVESIINTLKTMNFNIRNAFDVMKFEAGG